MVAFVTFLKLHGNFYLLLVYFFIVDRSCKLRVSAYNKQNTMMMMMTMTLNLLITKFRTLHQKVLVGPDKMPQWLFRQLLQTQMHLNFLTPGIFAQRV